jgi:hypothetical protein
LSAISGSRALCADFEDDRLEAGGLVFERQHGWTRRNRRVRSRAWGYPNNQVRGGSLSRGAIPHRRIQGVAYMAWQQGLIPLRGVRSFVILGRASMAIIAGSRFL